jgi:hypothetical protein
MKPMGERLEFLSAMPSPYSRSISGSRTGPGRVWLEMAPALSEHPTQPRDPANDVGASGWRGVKVERFEQIRTVGKIKR